MSIEIPAEQRSDGSCACSIVTLARKRYDRDDQPQWDSEIPTELDVREDCFESFADAVAESERRDRIAHEEWASEQRRRHEKYDDYADLKAQYLEVVSRALDRGELPPPGVPQPTREPDLSFDRWLRETTMRHVVIVLRLRR